MRRINTLQEFYNVILEDSNKEFDFGYYLFNREYFLDISKLLSNNSDLFLFIRDSFENNSSKYIKIRIYKEFLIEILDDLRSLYTKGTIDKGILFIN